MESNLPSELVFKILGYLEPRQVSQYMSASKSTLESGQEIKKSKTKKLISQMSPKKVKKVLSKVKTDQLYWSKSYKELRKQKLSDEIRIILKDLDDKPVSQKLNKFIELGNLLIDNQNVLSTMEKFKASLKPLFVDYHRDARIPDKAKWVIEMIFMELYPKDYDETFGYQLNIF
jgi:dGTP triphosphohydrolase